MNPVRFFGALERPLPGQPLPAVIKYRKASSKEGDKRRSAYYVVEWKEEVEFDNGNKKKSIYFQ